MKKKVYFGEDFKKPKEPEKPFDWNEVEWFLIAKRKGKEAKTSLTLDALTDKNKFDGIVLQVKQVIEKM